MDRLEVQKSSVHHHLETVRMELESMGQRPFALHGLCLVISCVMLCCLAAQARTHTSCLPKHSFLHCMTRV